MLKVVLKSCCQGQHDGPWSWTNTDHYTDMLDFSSRSKTEQQLVQISPLDPSRFDSSIQHTKLFLVYSSSLHFHPLYTSLNIPVTFPFFHILIHSTTTWPSSLCQIQMPTAEVLLTKICEEADGQSTCDADITCMTLPSSGPVPRPLAPSTGGGCVHTATGEGRWHPLLCKSINHWYWQWWWGYK